MDNHSRICDCAVASATSVCPSCSPAPDDRSRMSDVGRSHVPAPRGSLAADWIRWRFERAY
jgi:hypothetical protein